MKTHKYIILFAVILIIGTILLKINDGELDKIITNYFYNESLPLGQRFPLENVQPWNFLNEYNDIFEYFLYLTLIPMIILGLINRKKWGYLAYFGIYAFLSAFTGVVICVNMIFKGLYGRPRPRQTFLWPNSTEAEMFDFYSVWEPAFWKDPSLIGVGKSFPSGHVSIVAVFIIFYYIFKHPVYWAEKVKKWDYKAKLRLFTFFKWAGLFISIILGILTGVARIVVGAHHASDVLWAFGMIYIINAIFYYWIFNIPKYELKKDVS
ncbi:MAG: phosphatase PAP2 family protein [Candidatus Lokiarchaeota archaeon]|nr:phosphatase PAP2 family protein [Candidatus Harpocratesius repetitus]